MTQGLKEKIRKYLMIEGHNEGMAKLVLATGKSPQMIRRYIRGDNNASPDISYRLALACGCSEEDATKLAKVAPQKVRVTA